jgi:hypothetical protein
MSTQFINAMSKENNWKLTENQADALKSTTNALLDLFGTIGALRTRSDQDVEQLFSKAFSEDKLLATKMSFYARNIRGGLGERRVSRTIWKWLAKIYPEIMQKNLWIVPEFGRWDDLYEFVGTSIEKDMWRIITDQWKEDLLTLKENKPVSLLAKWLKSVNTSSKESNKLGKLTAKQLGLSESQYRKTLSVLRKRIDIVERKMSSNEWKDIKYPRVPSKAMTNYRKAFYKHDEDGFAKYLEAVKKGEVVIHSETLYPYDIMEKIFKGEYNEVLEQQWKALPNYVEGENNILVMADVSWSMSGRPIATSVGLAIYFAERNKGIFKDVFMTFSAKPEFVKLVGNTLYEKANNARTAHWDMNTDIEAAFKMIINASVSNHLKQEDMPKSLIIISDMEFDDATTQRTGYYNSSITVDRKTYYQHMKQLYAENGYELPKIVFWNVDARSNTFHAIPEDGVQFASGQATSVFQSIISNSEFGAYEMMVNTLNNPVYEVIEI